MSLGRIGQAELLTAQPVDPIRESLSPEKAVHRRDGQSGAAGGPATAIAGGEKKIAVTVQRGLNDDGDRGNCADEEQGQ